MATEKAIYNEKLIELVKAHPVLWNIKLKEHKNRNAIGKAWQEVAEGMEKTGILI